VSARDRAKVGEVLWVVEEHFYTPVGSCISEKEYCVCSSEVVRLFPKWDEMALHTRGADGYLHLHYYKNKDIGSSGHRGKLPSMPLSSPRRTIGCGPT
jgi:hypothetical protein